MKIDIICIGKLKEGYLRDAAAEYLKRLPPYAKVAVRELAETTVEKEGRALCAALEKTAASAYKIALAIDGRAMSSEKFARTLSGLAVDGTSHVVFVIGGSDGLSPAVLAGCHMGLSLSPMTFTHQMARTLLLEQLYRAFKIIHNEPYHK